MKLPMFLALALSLGCARQGPVSPDSGARPLSLRVPVFPKGPSHDVSEDRGHVVFLDVWATWCDACKEALPAYREMLRSFGSDVHPYALSVDEDSAKVSEYLKQMPLPFPVLFDPGGHAAEQVLKVQVMPTSFVLDRRGVIRFVHRGYSPDLPERLRAEIEQLLAERS